MFPGIPLNLAAFDSVQPLRPSEARPFVHKKILGGISKIAGILPIPGAGIITTITDIVRGGGGDGGGRGRGRDELFLPMRPAGCPGGLRRNDQGLCVEPTSPFGAQEFQGEAIMGRFGAAIVPGSRITDIAVCPYGMALGKDRLCYDHLPNRDRLYPRGRRPLLTGGDMRAISRASSAGKKLDRTNARLRGLGLMKPEAVRKRKTKKIC